MTSLLHETTCFGAADTEHRVEDYHSWRQSPKVKIKNTWKTVCRQLLFTVYRQLVGIASFGSWA